MSSTGKYAGTVDTRTAGSSKGSSKEKGKGEDVDMAVRKARIENDARHAKEVFVETLQVFHRFMKAVIGGAGLVDTDYSGWLSVSGFDPSATILYAGLQPQAASANMPPGGADYLRSTADPTSMMNALVQATPDTFGIIHSMNSITSEVCKRAIRKHTSKYAAPSRMFSVEHLHYPYVTSGRLHQLEAYAGHGKAIVNTPPASTSTVISDQQWQDDRFTQTNVWKEEFTAGTLDDKSAKSTPSEDSINRTVLDVVIWRACDHNLVGLIKEPRFYCCILSAIAQIKEQSGHEYLSLWECITAEGSVFSTRFAQLCSDYLLQSSRSARAQPARDRRGETAGTSIGRVAYASRGYFKYVTVSELDGTVSYDKERAARDAEMMVRRRYRMR
jgi:hypothetical protein